MIDSPDHLWERLASQSAGAFADDAREVLDHLQYNGLSRLNAVEADWLTLRVVGNLRVARASQLFQVEGWQYAREELAAALIATATEVRLAGDTVIRWEVLRSVCEDLPFCQEARITENSFGDA